MVTPRDYCFQRHNVIESISNCPWVDMLLYCPYSRRLGAQLQLRITIRHVSPHTVLIYTRFTFGGSHHKKQNHGKKKRKTSRKKILHIALALTNFLYLTLRQRHSPFESKLQGHVRLPALTGLPRPETNIRLR